MLNLNAIKPVSNLQEITRIPGGICFETSLGRVEIVSYAEGIFRIRNIREIGTDYHILVAEQEPFVGTIVRQTGSYEIRNYDDMLKIDTNPFRFSAFHGEKCLLHSADDGHFAQKYRLPAFGSDGENIYACIALKSGEPVYGLGEKYGPLNRRGQLIESRNHDALGVNTELSYKNCPFGFSPEGWGIFINTPESVTHGVGYGQWSHRSYVIKTDDTDLDLFIILGEKPADILKRYTYLTGRSPHIPEWSLGVWMSRAYYKTAEEALTVAKEIRSRKIPCDVFTLDGRTWLDTETRFSFEWDSSRYPEPTEFINKLKSHDYKLCVWEYPFVSIRNPLFQELEKNGWFLKDKKGKTYVYHWDMSPFGKVLTPLPPSGIIDFTNKNAYKYFQKSNISLFKSGIDAVKTDFGEQIPDDCYADNGDSGRRLHNIYPILYNRCVYEAGVKHFDGEFIVWGRSGWTGSQRYPIQWGGDPQADWEGLAASIRGGLSWGMSGGPFYSHDIGGFYPGSPDPELYIRWLQAGVLSSHCRFHGIGPREPWYFGEAVEKIARNWLEFRYQLLPYLKLCAQESSKSGLPVMRSMVLEFPDDPLSWGFDEQYMLGDCLLVAPVIVPHGKKKVYLPPGEWFDYWTGEKQTGGKLLHTESRLDKIPIYAKSGKILPLGPVVQNTLELKDGKRIIKLNAYGFPQKESIHDALPFKIAYPADSSYIRIDLPETVSVESYGDISIRTAPSTNQIFKTSIW